MSVLFVCHANICRSPMAERLAAALAPGLASGGLAMVSVGTHAVGGEAMHPSAAQALREVGADPTGHTSRPITAAVIGAAALVLTATRQQRGTCVALAPAALGRVFTLRQFGRLSAAANQATVAGCGPAERLAALRAEVARVRGTLQPVPTAADDLADPVNSTQSDVRACLALIRTALLPWLSLVDVGPAGPVRAHRGGLMAGHRCAAGGWPCGSAAGG